MWLSRSLVKAFACVLCGLLFVGLSCDGNGATQPTITLKAVDCPKGAIDLLVTVTNKPNDTDKDVRDVTVTVKVLCADAPIPFPQIIIDWWGLHTQKLTADENGEIVGKFAVSSDPTGEEVTVTVEGSDGEKEVVVKPVPSPE